jgi:hypothetical protein
LALPETIFSFDRKKSTKMVFFEKKVVPLQHTKAKV